MDTLAALRSGHLTGARRLKLSCGLTEFPREIFELADSLEVLDLSGNALSALPPDMSRLRRLRVLFCSGNRFTRVPESLGDCASLTTVAFKSNQVEELPEAALPAGLRWLILTDNRLEALPPALGRCHALEKLMLAGNRLRELPDEMAACRALGLVRIAANQFEALPGWLTSLPRLAWLAYAGNPFSDAYEGAAHDGRAHESGAHQGTSPAYIAWEQLRLLGKLGEGASGVIHEGVWRKPAAHVGSGSAWESPGDAPVAVKLFKGAITSDGLPRSEMAACLAAGRHPNLIPLRGRLSDHPEQTQGVIMDMIDSSFVNLAGPPGMETCTRDVYGEHLRFSLDAALRIATGAASVTAHLHARRILHGDLYAHNMLTNLDGDCLLGDFGAASFLPPSDASLSVALQRLEVRAFACLLEELIDRVTSPDSRTLQALRSLHDACDQPEVSARPLFADIHRRLTDIHTAA